MFKLPNMKDADYASAYRATTPDDRKIGREVGRGLEVMFIYDCVYPESLGGVEHRNYRLARALADMGHRVTLAGWVAGESPAYRGVTVAPMALRARLYDKSGKRSLLTSLRFALACLSVDLRPFDVVETANIPYIHLLPLAVRCAWSRKPLVITWHEYFGRAWWSYKGNVSAVFFAVTEWFCAQLGGKVCAISPMTARRLENAKIKADKVDIMPCGIDLEKIVKFQATGVGAPLVYAGRLMVEKRIDILLEAVGKLSAPPSGVILNIIGDGPDRARLEALSARLGIADKIKFHGKVPTSEDVWRIMAQSRIAIQPSAREGFGMFPLEAMALGLPVVYCESPDSAVGEIVGDGVEGVRVEADPDALAAAIENLLVQTELRKDLSANAVAKARHYGWPAIADSMLSLFHDAMERK